MDVESRLVNKNKELLDAKKNTHAAQIQSLIHQELGDVSGAATTATTATTSSVDYEGDDDEIG